VLIAVVSLVVYQALPREPPHKLLSKARRALQMREFARAEQLVGQIPAGAREYADGLLIDGEAATRQNHFEQAIACYEKIPAGDGEASLTATYCIGDLLFQLGEASEAETRYRRVLAVRPSDEWAREQLASLLTNFGRHWEALPHLFELVRTQRASVEQLDVASGSNHWRFARLAFRYAGGDKRHARSCPTGHGSFILHSSCFILAFSTVARSLSPRPERFTRTIASRPRSRARPMA
jgi:tetratricopeptide (TPR) repeat protein